VAPRPRVLVVEDDAALRKVLELRLALEGFDVVLAKDGQAGVEALGEVHPDVVVCDLMMPRLDGFGFCRTARDREGSRDLPIVVLTARQKDAEIEELLELGDIVFMGKPFDAPTLTSTLRKLTERRRAARGA
jgi:two-component system phosphate regulon response regulator PhoB